MGISPQRMVEPDFSGILNSIIIGLLLICAWDAGADSPYTTDACERIYPYISEVHAGPWVTHSDEELGPEPWTDTVETAYFWRLLFDDLRESANVQIELVRVFGGEASRFEIDKSFALRFGDLLDAAPMWVHFGEWRSPHEFTLILFEDECHAFTLDTLSEEIQVSDCHR